MGLKRTYTSVATLLLLGVLCVAGSVRADPPADRASGSMAPRIVGQSGPTAPLLHYQGRLTDPATGEAIADGGYLITFRLYNVASGGSALWTETKEVSLQGGILSTTLGDWEPLDPGLFDGQALWLGVQVDPDDEAAPRQRMLPVAYALSLVPGAQIAASSNSAAIAVSNAGSGVALQVDGATSLNGNLSVSGSLTGGSHDHWGESWSGSGTGLTLSSSNYDGLLINSVGRFGIQVSSPSKDGIWITNPGDDGVDIDGAAGNGLRVDGAGFNGVEVWDATFDGLHVSSAGRFGVQIGSPADDAIYVSSPGGDGIDIRSTSGNGMRLDGAGINGIEIWNATYDGVQVNSAGRYGVQANTNGTYGFFTPDKIYAGTGYDDIAEHIDATGQVEPGDVVVIDPERDEHVVISTKAYDPAVAGIISTDPAMLIGDSESETPLALAGRVPCKVSAENGPVRRGDLLTTSETPGHAMKATEPTLGTILGKAMGELDSGTGVIPVLVTLQ